VIGLWFGIVWFSVNDVGVGIEVRWLADVVIVSDLCMTGFETVDVGVVVMLMIR